ncbi:MAG: homoserine dehydrogenase, partial [Oscillospiraceae bacterium]|nr:homoserine dehydrogenase [Oscillospiraceae bacterium]
MKIAILGHGVVGSGTAEVLSLNQKIVANNAGEEIEIKYILDLLDFPGAPYADRFIKDFSVIESDPEVAVVVECIGGISPAYDFIRRSLAAGKSVVTSNKELVAEKGQELLEIAKRSNLNFLFEASVGGGIPIIRPLAQCMAANEVGEVAGILNGTTNFILTKMISENMSFDGALRLAQRMGYAERDPADDVDGCDACRKICILASLAFGKHVHPDSVPTAGIRDISPEDVTRAGAAGYVVKLLGVARKLSGQNGSGNKLEIWVAPALVPKTHQISGVNDVFNGILVRGNATGEVMFYGRGAGKFPTAGAIISDMAEALRIPEAAPMWSEEEAALSAPGESINAW